jgi:hypothetical protein
MSLFVACPACSCVVKSADPSCPHCGATVRASDGSIAQTAIAIVLGLSAVTALSGCPSNAPPPPAPKYGVPATIGPDPGTAPTTTVGSPDPTAAPTSPDTPPEVAPKYGVPATTAPQPEVRPLYGVAGTPSSN